MATLLAAVLLAMMGVLPALAGSTASVPLTVTVIPVVSISVEPTSVDFGGVGPGTTQNATIDINNDGDVNVTVTAEISGAFYTANLAITGNYTSLVTGAIGFAYLNLTIPGDAVGTYNGSILFTATGP